MQQQQLESVAAVAVAVLLMAVRLLVSSGSYY